MCVCVCVCLCGCAMPASQLITACLSNLTVENTILLVCLWCGLNLDTLHSGVLVVSTVVNANSIVCAVKNIRLCS